MTKLIFLGDTNKPWLSQQNDYKPANDAYVFLTENGIGKQAVMFLDEFVSFVRKIRVKDVIRLSMEFIVDDNEHVWLSKISCLETGIDQLKSYFLFYLNGSHP